MHGAYRAKTQAQQQRRLEFIERLSTNVPVHPLTLDIARLAGPIEGQQAAMGVQFAFEDKHGNVADGMTFICFVS